ncbi:transporter substrate-binding domain-containing protein [Zooshikella marina]|uniref:substrate-binding periplasmic protein n=1 Tax=Zooshikella ganghwensis TaxID=202772 RepID=UPI001BAED3D0|nr:transporter substrate-binding domain-containing protein [Zooshikella ganghwensis]MBU2704804.1 transporter substrate-binding domain-containing protein [Zooshikella ganghwensis]
MLSKALGMGLIIWSLIIPAGYAETIHLLTENFPPLNMSADEKNFARGNNVTGITTDIVRLMFKRANIDYRVTLRFPWKRVYDTALKQKNYGVFSTSRTPEREALFQWVGPLAEEYWVLLTKADSPITINSLSDAKPWRVGGYKDDALTKFLTSRGISVLEAHSDKLNVRKLKINKIDIWATGSLSGPYLAKQEGLVGLKQVFSFNKNDLYLALNKDTNPEVVKKLNEALSKMRQDGSIEKIYRQYR